MSVSVRPFRLEDLYNGYLECLNELSPGTLDVPGERSLVSAMEHLVSSSRRVYPIKLIFVADLNGRVIGTASLLLERKMSRGCKLVGHIEDVVVSRECRAGGVGRQLVECCKANALERGCRKVTLSCSEQNVAFYEKLGFHRNEVSMRLDLEC